jgi:hypothetical protein
VAVLERHEGASLLWAIFLLASLAEIGTSRKDVVLAEVGASAALVGFVLVFLGVLVTSYQAGLGNLSTKTLARFKRAAWIALVVFLLGLVTIAVSVLWLATDGDSGLYGTSIALFFGELVGLITVAVYSTWRVLLR